MNDLDKPLGLHKFEVEGARISKQAHEGGEVISPRHPWYSFLFEAELTLVS
jgi:hypothetical protein